jgi:hypothetical protein
MHRIWSHRRCGGNTYGLKRGFVLYFYTMVSNKYSNKLVFLNSGISVNIGILKRPLTKGLTTVAQNPRNTL